MRPFAQRLGIVQPVEALPPAIDLRPFFPPVIDQDPLNSCTAATTAALTSYFQHRAHGRALNASVMFLYKASRDLLGLQGDSGAFLRTAMQALRLFGVVPEGYWPYVPSSLDARPQAFHYAYAANYKAKAYYRLDDGSDTEPLLSRVKTNLAAQLPSMFGFFAFPSLSLSSLDGTIPAPARGEVPVLSHALVAVGYDDHRRIRNADGTTSAGALRVRNSWGPSWGELGYGWMPYDYVNRGLTSDWWSLVEADFVDVGQFGLP